MSSQCRIDPGCINWEMPETWFCDPCIDLGNPEHVQLLEAAWKTVTSFVYTETGEQWPGSCFRERVRPCIEDYCACPPRRCECYGCGRYNWLPLLDATCLPIIAVESVWVGPNRCEPCPQVWTPGNGDVRLEYVDDAPRLVIQDLSGCCGTWPKQDLCVPTYGCGTWHIDLITGCPPPPHVLHGAMEMAMELVKGCVKHGCRLPGNITRQSFDGMTVEFDTERGATLPLQMLDRVLSREPVLREWFQGPSGRVSWHHVYGPVASCECPNLCGTDGCDGRPGSCPHGPLVEAYLPFVDQCCTICGCHGSCDCEPGDLVGQYVGVCNCHGACTCTPNSMVDAYVNAVCECLGECGCDPADLAEAYVNS